MHKAHGLFGLVTVFKSILIIKKRAYFIHIVNLSLIKYEFANNLRYFLETA